MTPSNTAPSPIPVSVIRSTYGLLTMAISFQSVGMALENGVFYYDKSNFEESSEPWTATSFTLSNVS